ncbi:MAG: hypothetical protein LBP67_05125 [Bacteroidales bacterium]|jgi:hypothetical protein|nr:hypothetical protein [Bacteroidales bacterium]
MTTIKEFAEEYAKEKTNPVRGFVLNSYLAFKAGAEFAQQWISVEEELPDNPDEVILVKDMGDNVYTAVWEHNAWYVVPFHTDVMIENVKYWRPIERK